MSDTVFSGGHQKLIESRLVAMMGSMVSLLRTSGFMRSRASCQTNGEIAAPVHQLMETYAF